MDEAIRYVAHLRSAVPQKKPSILAILRRSSAHFLSVLLDKRVHSQGR